MKKSLAKNAALYRNFREREPKRARKLKVNFPDVLTVMGKVDFIGYSTTHGSKAVAYKHEFARGSKPLFCADARTGKIYLIGGRYRVTSRGIVDLDSKRREIE